MITAQQIAQFHRDGFLIIRGVFKGQELKDLQAAADRVTQEGIANQGKHHIYHTQPDGARTYYRSERMWDREPIFKATTVNPTLLEAIAQCVGRPFLPMNDSYVCKLPRGNVPIPWHQDPPYGFLGEKSHKETLACPNFDTDIYLDHSNVKNGCVWGIPGHHLVGKVDIEKYSQEEMFEKFGAVPMIMEPGDVLLHALSAPHGSIGNVTDSTRRIFYVHYMAEEVIEKSYGGWFFGPHVERKLGFNPGGIEYIRGFIEARELLGLSDIQRSHVRFSDKGFELIDGPGTSPDLWEKLIAAIPEDQKNQKRRLTAVNV